MASGRDNRPHPISDKLAPSHLDNPPVSECHGRELRAAAPRGTPESRYAFGLRLSGMEQLDLDDLGPGSAIIAEFIDCAGLGRRVSPPPWRRFESIATGGALQPARAHRAARKGIVCPAGLPGESTVVRAGESEFRLGLRRTDVAAYGAAHRISPPLRRRPLQGIGISCAPEIGPPDADSHSGVARRSTRIFSSAGPLLLAVRL